MGEDSSDCAMGGSYQSVHAWTQASLHGDYVLVTALNILELVVSLHTGIAGPSQLYMASFVGALGTIIISPMVPKVDWGKDKVFGVDYSSFLSQGHRQN